MNFRVELTTPAEADVRGTVDYLRERTEPGTQAWRRAFGEMLRRLKVRPTSCGIAPENDLFEETIRQALFRTKSGRTHRAVFLVRDDVVHVLRVRGPGQDLLRGDEIDLP